MEDCNTQPPEEDYLPIAALNDVLFCERRCVLHRREEVWIENRYTLEGTAAHRRVHGEPAEEELDGGRRARHVWLRSDRLRLIGVSDVVEFRDRPFPVEYKRGRRRRWDNDDVQLCAQALCLEEMLAVEIPAGAIYHVASRRRREVAFDDRLRALTERAAARLHELVAGDDLPPPINKPRCRRCSLCEICMPEIIAARERYSDYVRRLYEAAPEPVERE